MIKIINKNIMESTNPATFDNYDIEDTISKKELRDFAKKCLKYIKDKKLDITTDQLDKYLNEDILQRFMTARENNEKKAFEMWEHWLTWRLQYKPEEFNEKLIENELKSGKAFLHGYDKEGRPCIVVKNARHIPEKTDMDEFMKFFIYMVDKACRLADE